MMLTRQPCVILKSFMFIHHTHENSKDTMLAWELCDKPHMIKLIII